MAKYSTSTLFVCLSVVFYLIGVKKSPEFHLHWYRTSTGVLSRGLRFCTCLSSITYYQLENPGRTYIENNENTFLPESELAFTCTVLSTVLYRVQIDSPLELFASSSNQPGASSERKQSPAKQPAANIASRGFDVQVHILLLY